MKRDHYSTQFNNENVKTTRFDQTCSSTNQTVSTQISASSVEIRSQTVVKNVEPTIYSIEKILELAQSQIFPKSEFKFADRLHAYTPILNLFESKKTFPEIPAEKIRFECKGCHKFVYYCRIGKTCDLNRHLRIYCKSLVVREWYKHFQTHKPRDKPILSKEELLLIKFIVSSNSPLVILKNPFFKEMLSSIPNMPLPGMHFYFFLSIQ
jgi:hypothetical protein